MRTFSLFVGKGIIYVQQLRREVRKAQIPVVLGGMHQGLRHTSRQIAGPA